MFDIGGWEFLVIIVIAIIVIGPKDIPGTIRTLTGWIRKARELARDFQSGLDDLAHQAELDEVKNDIQSGLGLDEVRNTGNTIRAEIEQSIDPGGEIAGTFKDDDGLSDEDEPTPEIFPEKVGDLPLRDKTGVAGDAAPARASEAPADGVEKAADAEKKT